MKLFRLILKNLFRNKLRSALTVLAVMLLVAIFSMIATVIRFLDNAMVQKTRDLKLIVTERYRIPSRFDRRFVDDIVQPGSSLNDLVRKVPGYQPGMFVTWHFAGFTLDPEMKDKDKLFFIVAAQPEKLATMTDGLEGFDTSLTELMKRPPRSGIDNIGIVVGPDRLQKMGKRVGDVFKAKSISHREGIGLRQPIEMEFEIVGELPGVSRWSSGAFMDYEYLDRVLKEKKSDMDGKVNLLWLQVTDVQSASEIAALVEHYLPDVKCESASTAVGRFMEPFKNLLNGVKYLLVPAIIAVMTVIIANAIGITVRERRTEIAVLKVLGFGSLKILVLVLGEALLVGIIGGEMGAGLTYALINKVGGGLRVPIGFFPVFYVPAAALWWGPTLGAATAFFGSFWPAWNARRVKVAEVFSKVA